jgi:hypothetical protein
VLGNLRKRRNGSRGGAVVARFLNCSAVDFFKVLLLFILFKTFV